MAKVIKLLTLAVSLASVIVGCMSAWSALQVRNEVQSANAPIEEALHPHKEGAGGHAVASSGGEHEKPAEHGGGHGEAAPAGGHGGGGEHGAKPAAHGEAAGGHGGGGHGEAAPAGGHGGGHGEAAASGHGGAERAPASSQMAMAPLLSIDEVISNIGSSVNTAPHLLGVKMDIELFDEESRASVESYVAGIRNIILLTSSEHSYESLSSLPGKLYYKEQLVSRLNEFFNKAVIRDIHFASFYLQ